jgi:hypothetical protein
MSLCFLRYNPLGYVVSTDGFTPTLAGVIDKHLDSRGRVGQLSAVVTALFDEGCTLKHVAACTEYELYIFQYQQPSDTRSGGRADFVAMVNK